MIIKALNNLSDQSQNTFLSVAEASGTNSIRVKNINGAYASWAVQLGKTGEEQSEIKVLGAGAPSGTTLSLTANTTYSHPSDTPVYYVKYDQMVFERSTAGTAGTATPMTNGTVTITPDSLYTQFDDTSGSASYAYRVYFRNSVLDAVSLESDWLTPAGYSYYSLFRMRDRAKRKLQSASYIQDDKTIDDWLNEWLETMNNVAIDVNKDYSIGTTSVTFSGTAELGTITANDFKEIRRVWLNGYEATKKSLIDVEPQTTYGSASPYYYMQGDNVIGRKPADTDGTASIVYYKMQDLMADDTDELPVSMRAYTKSFVDYCMSQAYYLDEKKDLGDRYMNQAQSEKETFRMQITPRSKSGPQTIEITDVIDANDIIDIL